jgi:hypothetical protein
MTFQEVITATEESKRQDITQQHSGQSQRGFQTPKWFKFRGARRRLAAAEQLKAGLAQKPARLEAAGDAPWGLTSRLAISELDEESWDFDGRG